MVRLLFSGLSIPVVFMALGVGLLSACSDSVVGGGDSQGSMELGEDSSSHSLTLPVSSSETTEPSSSVIHASSSSSNLGVSQGASHEESSQDTLLSSSSEMGSVSSTLSSTQESSSIHTSSVSSDISSSVMILESSSSTLSSSQIQESSSEIKKTPSQKRASLNEKIEYIFDDDMARNYEIIIDDAALARLDANPVIEEYEYADLVFEGDTIKNIQVRYKGSWGGWVNCVENYDGMSNTGGEKICIKLSLKVKFNTAEEPDRKFFGMKKMAFYHMNHYENQMLDRLSYWIHREMGNPAPRAVHSTITINGELIGLFTAIENIDGRFTRAHWNDGEGNLYKDINPIDSSNSITSTDVLNDHLKTNEDENPTHEIWNTFESELLDASNEDDIKDVIRKWTNVPQLISTIITSIAIGHWDSPFGGWENNAYWYSDTTNKKLYPIPWDMDFNNFNANEFSFNGNLLDNIQQDLACQSTNKNKLMQYWLCFPNEADTVLNKLLTDIYPRIEDKLINWEAQITDTHKLVRTLHPGTFPHTGALSYDEWQNELTIFKNKIEEGRQSVLLMK